MSDYDDDEFRDDESYHDDDLDSVDWEVDNDELIDETDEKNQLLDEKVKLIILFNEDTLDIDEFNFKMKTINTSLEDLTFINDYYNNVLLEKEDYFMQILNTYTSEIKRNKTPRFLSTQQVKNIYTMYEEIKNLREKCMNKEVKETMPLESQSLDQTLEKLFKDEQKYLQKIAKEVHKKGLTQELIQEPLKESFPDINSYNHAYDLYIRKISKYINTFNYVQNMNVTSIGSTFEKYEQSIKEKLIELKDIQSELPIQVSDKDKIFFKNRSILKQIMMKMNMDSLINCALEAESYNMIENIPEKEKYKFEPSVLEKIRKYSRAQNYTLRGVITKTLRNQSVKRLRMGFNSSFMNQVENEIFILSQNDINIYTNKVNDIIFILEHYPHFKNLDINPRQLALFEKEITFEVLVNVADITKRRSTIRLLKSALLKNTLYKNKVIKNYMCYTYSKKLELLIYDISKNNKMYVYYSEKLFNHIRENPNRVFKESKEKILIFLQLKFKKQKITFDFSKLDIRGVRALLSQERIMLDELIKTKNSKLIKIKNKKIKNLEKRMNKLREEEEKGFADSHFITDGRITEDNTLKTIILNNEMMNELIQAYKRKLMIDSLKISFEYKNKLIHYLEILDINNLLNKNRRLQTKIAPLLVQLLPHGYIFLDFNNYYYNQSFETINSLVQNSSNNQYTIHFNPSQKITDYYGNKLLIAVQKLHNPIDFYDRNLQKDYYKLLEQVKETPLPEYKKLRIFYDPHTGRFGDPTSYLFDIHKLQSNSNGEPLMEKEPTTFIDPRTGEIKHTFVIVPIPGRESFIKVPILTNKKDQFNYQWIKVPNGKVPHLYALDFDSCDRFSKKECKSGKGIGNSTCTYVNRKCKATYNLTKQDNELLKEENESNELEQYAQEGRINLSFGKKKILIKKQNSGYYSPKVSYKKNVIKYL